MASNLPISVDVPPLFGALAVVRQVERTIDALTADLPAAVRDPLVTGARLDVEAAEALAVDWLPPDDLSRMIAKADRARAKARAARGGMSVYEAERIRRGED